VRLLVKQTVRALDGELVIPSSKYHAHRALILASLAPGTSRIEGLSDAGHVRTRSRPCAGWAPGST
jgi:cyclohexanecarboxylate-CoA ligase